MKNFKIALIFLSVLFKSCYQFTYIGRVHENYFTNEMTSTNQWKCLEKQCKSRDNCAITFDKKNKRCYRLSLTSQMLIWDYDWDKRLFSEVWNAQWQIRCRNPTIKVPRPTIMWILDNVSKGVNIGQASRYLDISADAVDWTEIGPKGTEVLQRYGRSSSEVKRELFNEDGQPLIDVTQQYTIALWIKTDPVQGDYVVIDFMPADALRLMLFPGNQRNSLSLGSSSTEYAGTSANSTKVNGWRHVAVVVYTSANIYFFLEGHRWPAKTMMQRRYKRSHPFSLSLWSQAKPHLKKYKGSYACVSIFQRALKAAQIQALRSSCP